MPRRARTPEEVAHDEFYKLVRRNMIQHFKQTPVENLSDEELLALLLSFSIKKCDFNEAARNLLNEYGSFNNIFNARMDSLMLSPIVELHTALMIKGVPAMCQKMMLQKVSKHMKINKPQNAYTYMRPYFIGFNYEQVYLLILKDNYYPMEIMFLSEGSGNDVYIDVNRILREAVMHNSSKLVLAHSHPKSAPKPSFNDKVTTIAIAEALGRLQIQLLDHLIIGKGQCYYMSEDEDMNQSILAFSKKPPVSMQENYDKKN